MIDALQLRAQVTRTSVVVLTNIYRQKDVSIISSNGAYLLLEGSGGTVDGSDGDVKMAVTVT